MMNKISLKKTLLSGLCVLNICGLGIILDKGNEAEAVRYDYYTYKYSKNPYLKITDEVEWEANRLAEQIPNYSNYPKDYGNPKGKVFEGVGIISNAVTNMSGTAFVIDDYTVLTNEHLVNYRGSQQVVSPSNMTFYPNSYKNRFVNRTIKIKAIYKMPGVNDLAVIRTVQKVTNYTKPIKLASYKEVESLSKGIYIKSVGYPSWSGFTPKFVSGRSLVLDKPNQLFANKLRVDMGQSGSPILNKYNRAVGIVSYNFDNSPYMKGIERSGGVPFTYDVKKFIYKYKK